MKLTKFKLLAIISLACVGTTHADELSDLISAVANRNDMATLVTTVTSSTVQPNGMSSVSHKLNSGYLNDIADVMTEDGALDFILNTVNHQNAPKQNYSTSYRQWMTNPLITTKGFFRPVPGIVTSNFGWRSEFNRMHHGVDLRLNIGDTVRAAMTGTVKKVGFDAKGYGHYVVLTHPDGMETLYGHLQYATAFAGQMIQIGTPVGIGGNTGNSTGPHLHFEARLNGVAIDPTMIFNFNNGSYEDYTDKTQNISEKNQINTALGINHSLTSRRTYVVRQGDTPVTVAQRAGISVMRLCQLNMISDNEPLEVGRMLKLK
ncbi:MAG: peptidoglycan DD-metalloendopeptidase family protein [Muribaculum sp.]|nr:peptidoglycan DD-metalloendopeptidase family protein [Muribaculum sp.]